jgi:hypothetical protein
MPQHGARVPHFVPGDWWSPGQKPPRGLAVVLRVSHLSEGDQRPAANARWPTRRFFRWAVAMDKHAMLRYGIKRRRALERLRLIEAEEAAILAKFPELAEPPPSRTSQARTRAAARDVATDQADRLDDPPRMPRIRFH